MPAWAWKITMVWRTRRADVQGALVHRLGPLQLTVVEQHPAEAGLERSGEAAEQRLVGRDGRLQRRDRGRVVTGALVEVGDHAEADRAHHRPVEAPRSPRWRPGSAARRRRGRRRGAPAWPASTSRAATANGSSGACAVEVEHDPAPAAGLVEVTAHGGLLGVERVGQRHRLRRRRGVRRSPAPRPGRRRCARRRRRGSRGAHGRSTPSARVRSSTSPRQANASSSQRRPSTTMPVSQCGQAAPPAIEQRGLGVVVGDGPVERRSEVVVLGVDRRQPRPLPVTGVRGCALRAQLGVVPGHRVPDRAPRRPVR